MKTVKDCERVDLKEEYCYPPVQEILVTSYLVHQQYDNPKFANDIGIVQLAKPVEISGNKNISRFIHKKINHSDL